MSEHTKEPWTYQKECVGNYQIAHDHSGAGTLEVTANTITEANARRIVACVNACAGIPSIIFEAWNQQGRNVKSEIEDKRILIEELTEQRDELLAALKDASEEYKKLPHSLGYPLTHCNKWDELIAKVESEK